MEDILAFVPGPRAFVKGQESGVLAGLSFAAKDLFDVRGIPTGAGNHDPTRCRRKLGRQDHY